MNWNALYLRMDFLQILIFLLFFPFSCRIIEIFSFMQKILSWTYIWFSFLVSLSVYANNDVTSQNFTVDLSNLDPLGGSHSAWGSGVGKYAFRWIIENITNIMLFMIPIIAAISLLVAGYFYIFSAWDSEKASKAKMIIKWNIIALLVAFFSYAIISIVASFFNTY